ncbi:tRNA dihydrouridine(20/20a) synthase DusA [Niveibacterium microcysteis]|uniref:tRNA-dihydrouridine(20/20a) synthase n=1 Tax=Niveibacterium microcysteis TaxID=2811415 RepID=A0ABX7MBN1_9RHOO|nr:tRNA dihydrouridine(20/20a) synthase DusA [Niveibacterium microcysteis]QSI76907.1 tRNA dihydrouridine(20/20a) synthase DusA [Niveibacterium microcysteis]
MTHAAKPLPPRRLSVAPMLDWTDRHCRYFHRLLAPHAWLYTEMVTTGALQYGDVERHLRFHGEEHPVALQLGGSDPAALAHAAKLGEAWGYDEINLNCGCPSERVQNGAFGACLMAEPELVRDGCRAMRDVVSIPVTVKHRIGIDRIEDYSFVRDFVGTVAEAGVTTFIVHARNAWLKGLSPKENREIPPLRYEFAHRLKQEFPEFEILVNGGLASTEQIEVQLKHVDGVMIGREAYQNPWALTEWERALFAPEWAPSREHVIAALVSYCEREKAQGTTVRAIVRHVLGLANGLPGARGFRRLLSDPQRLRADDPQLLWEAWACVSTSPTDATTD